MRKTTQITCRESQKILSDVLHELPNILYYIHQLHSTSSLVFHHSFFQIQNHNSIHGFYAIVLVLCNIHHLTIISSVLTVFMELSVLLFAISFLPSYDLLSNLYYLVMLLFVGIHICHSLLQVE